MFAYSVILGRDLTLESDSSIDPDCHLLAEYEWVI